MTEFDEFRVVFSFTPAPQAADPQVTGTWTALLTECPMEEFVGAKGSVEPKMSRDQLIRLRNPNGWPNLNELKSIGQRVWESLMTPGLEAAYVANLLHSKAAGCGMRLVVSIEGDEPEPADAEKIGMRELPLEALYDPMLSFLASDPATPISRSPKLKADRDPFLLTLPLRVLVVVATPRDKPDANMDEEKAAIRKALGKLSDPGGHVELKFCDPPTRAELANRLQNEKIHVLHFICHGGFDIAGDDPSPRPYLALEQSPDANQAHGDSEPLDAETLDQLLRNTDVQLVLMTACASASPTPTERPYYARAFDGVAQTLVRGVSRVSAVVAMQFDLESQAAVTFSKTFYTNLLLADRKLDEVVAVCRKSLIAECEAGHRSWVTPVVYWRAKDGKVFAQSGFKRAIDPEIQKQLNDIDPVRRTFLDNIAEVAKQPQSVQDAAASLVAEWQKKVDELQQQRSQLLGETLRLRGGSVKAGRTIPCRLTLRLREPAKIGDVEARIRYPSDKVTFVGATPGAATPGVFPLIASPADDDLRLMLKDASQGTEWSPETDDQELALLKFKVKPGVEDAFIELNVSDVQIQRNGADAPFEPLHAVLFID